MLLFPLHAGLCRLPRPKNASSLIGDAAAPGQPPWAAGGGLWLDSVRVVCHGPAGSPAVAGKHVTGGVAHAGVRCWQRCPLGSVLAFTSPKSAYRHHKCNCQGKPGADKGNFIDVSYSIEGLQFDVSAPLRAMCARVCMCFCVCICE
jgi:hypothetical protein